jgi:hypothetical protein
VARIAPQLYVCVARRDAEKSQRRAGEIALGGLRAPSAPTFE